MIRNYDKKIFNSIEEYNEWETWNNLNCDHKAKKEYGDYQTPLELAERIINLLDSNNTDFSHIIEPTCGEGNFIAKLLDKRFSISSLTAIEIQQEYIHRLKKKIITNYLNVIKQLDEFTIVNENIFNVDINKYIVENSLIIGNLPWITSAELGKLDSINLPKKSNFQNRNGLDSVTGKANFDIAEFIIILILNSLNAVKSATIALLVKKSVAINIIKQINIFNWDISDYKLYNIDAKKEFNVSVDACLLYMKWNKSAVQVNTGIEYSLYNPKDKIKSFGYVNDCFVSNLLLYENNKFLEKKNVDSKLIWRSGVKHDSSKIMELDYKNGSYFAKDGTVFPESTPFIHPLIKSSDVKNINSNYIPRKGIIITQRFVGDNTSVIKEKAPILWNYLNSHSEKLNARKSVIYKNKPSFCIFGIGDYSFSPYKIIISGMYKSPKFSLVSSYNGKIIMIDDTTYSINFDKIEYALIALSALNSSYVQEFLTSIVFIGNKRPYTKDILERIDLLEVVRKLDSNFINKFINENNYKNKITQSDIDLFIRNYTFDELQ